MGSLRTLKSENLLALLFPEITISRRHVEQAIKIETFISTYMKENVSNCNCENIWCFSFNYKNMSAGLRACLIARFGYVGLGMLKLDQKYLTNRHTKDILLCSFADVAHFEKIDIESISTILPDLTEFYRQT
jgi:hypothetical protein